MNRRAIGIGIPREVVARFVTAALVAMTAGIGTISAQSPAPATVDGLLSAAKIAAGLDWPGTFLRLCIPPPAGGRGAGGGGRGANAQPAGRGGRGAAATAPASGPPRELWYAEPARVADNLYFLGTSIHNAWALVGSDGIIVFEALFDYAAPDEIVDGMRKLGLDKSKVKYIVISHAHADHDGGARFLQDSMPAARLVYGAADWDAVEKSPTHQGGKPTRDTVGSDGMKIAVGDASVQIVTMPGHTAGTLSFLFEVKDRGKPLRIAYVGGTAIPFDGSAAYYDQYLASTRKMAKAAADFGATALLSNHTEFDNAFYRAHTAANRKGSEANPFDVGRDAVGRYFTVVEDCVTAAKLRATGTK